MAQALAKGFIAGGVRKKNDIIASAPKSDLLSIEAFKKLGCRVVNDNRDVLKESEIVILATKPSVVPKVLSEVSNQVKLRHLIVSVALGVPISAMEEVLPMGSRVIRVMSNTPALVQEAASVFAMGNFANDGDAESVKELFSAVGLCEAVLEGSIDAVTGLSGSGPAYCYLAIEALADGGVKQGLPRDLAIKLAAQTLLGAAKMALKTGQHTGSLKDDVCSPGGCTINAVSVLERTGFRSSLIDAVEAATFTARATAIQQIVELNNAGNSDEEMSNSNGKKKIILNNILQ